MYALESVVQRQTSKALQNLFTGNEKENDTEVDYWEKTEGRRKIRSENLAFKLALLKGNQKSAPVSF